MCSILLLTGADRQKRSIFSVKNYNPLSQNEVQYYLQELQELKERLNGGTSHGGKSKKRERKSKKGGKKSTSRKEEPTWRAGMSWWDSRHGKKAGSSSGSWASSSSSSYKCGQPIAYGNTDCTAHTVRYYYEKASKMCRKFHYTGCGGNKNNFHSKRECMRKCRR
ncbi:TFPI2 [Mytilus coruscus]|uniref:TFPI2 n=1 Tax=Mytilus coruscus TaxID=42192 RepID=A0A6J8BPQ1_MYTCO|nr:TFPI2 [Mytilus coruscus]